MIRKLLWLIATVGMLTHAAYADVQTVSISANSGGGVVAYAMQAASYRRNNVRVQVTGRCDSACTLYLSLPRNRICVGQGAFFRFHAPSGTADVSEAQRFMMRKYPGWVRQWIAARGGLSNRLITMDYAYARKFLPDCAQLAAR